MAEQIILNAKVQRPGVCNAAEKLLIHESLADTVLPRIARALAAAKVELRTDAAAGAALARHGIAHTPAVTSDWSEEYLALILAVKLVPSLDAAIAFINTHSSAHTDAIITGDAAAAQRFLAGVDSAVVLWNASTRFNDGFEFGFGAEIGISTDKLHARGPMGLRELCTYKYLVTGSGQVRA
jgi:glutamate-5-semialdehyde dehydrogenase